jgi:hypothetical protein
VSFYDRWFLNIRPATDNRPFFHDFFRWESISKLRAAFGPLWPARSEMGFLMLVIATAWCTFAGAVLIAIPILIRRKTDVPSRALGVGAVIIYFALLGTAFMFLEMSYIQIFSRFLGNHVLAAALSVSGFLFFAGVGSFFQPKVTALLKGGIFTICLMLAGLIVLQVLSFSPIFEWVGLAPIWLRAMIGLTLIAPLAFLMGNPFPWGLGMLQQLARGHVPLAWAVNGFASVVATSGAVLIAMTYGFRFLLGAAAVLYAFVGILSVLVKEKTHSGQYVSTLRS